MTEIIAEWVDNDTVSTAVVMHNEIYLVRHCVYTNAHTTTQLNIPKEDWAKLTTADGRAELLDSDLGYPKSEYTDDEINEFIL